LKEQETAKGDKKKEKEAAVQETTAVQDTVVVQNIYHSTFLPMEEMSESYMTINTFSQILTVIFQTNTPVF
jgi:negative regulator of replication initiation